MDSRLWTKLIVISGPSCYGTRSKNHLAVPAQRSHLLTAGTGGFGAKTTSTNKGTNKSLANWRSPLGRATQRQNNEQWWTNFGCLQSLLKMLRNFAFNSSRLRDTSGDSPRPSSVDGLYTSSQESQSNGNNLPN
jgi:hypothetical protein